ncbi:MAG TPA: DNA damage-inducible protein D [Aquella sp.]|nr:DNA damage-inducible protein D [Aquella sp.]
MANNIKKTTNQSFEDIRQIDTNGNEFWYARALAKILDYADYRNFLQVIEKAKNACKKSGYNVDNHLVESNEQVQFGSGAIRHMDSYALSRYACYLIVQNGDSSKPVIANGQTYFALQTRRQELSANDQFNQLAEDEKRVLFRNKLKEHNKQLVKTAYSSGVENALDFAIFQNHGYKGLYGGLDAKAIHKHKGLQKSQKILDHMGFTELAANVFRTTQAEEKLKRDKIQGKTNANKTHYEVGKKVRETIQALGGTMPEDLPVAEDIQKLERKISAEKTINNNSSQKKLKNE